MHDLIDLNDLIYMSYGIFYFLCVPSIGQYRDDKPQTHQAKWENTLSVEQATTSQLIARNSSTRSLKAMISVGQTKVLKMIKKNKTSDCIYLLNKNMKNQRLYQQNNQENIITCITTQFENYLLYAYIHIA